MNFELSERKLLKQENRKKNLMKGTSDYKAADFLLTGRVNPVRYD